MKYDFVYLPDLSFSIQTFWQSRHNSPFWTQSTQSILFVKKAFIYSTYFAGLFLVFSPEAFFQYDIWRCFDPENQSEGAKY